jgi:3-phenylpropionate/trans-cinnamate dioxygenase ferredoxin subunit
MVSQDFVKVGNVGDLKPGEMKLVRMANERVLLCNFEGTYYAVDSVCTHENGRLNRGLFYKSEVACPLHGASFDVRTGKVITPPAVKGLTVYPVKVEGDDIFIGPAPH